MTHTRRTTLALALLLITLGIVRADAPAPAREIALFNGKDLTGWTWVSGKPGVKMEDVWSVVGGNLHTTGKPSGYLRTETDYTSFVLTMQVRHLSKGNGGVLIRMVGPDKVWPRSIECQGMFQHLGDIYNIDKFNMKTDPARTKGRFTQRLHPKLEQKPLGEWNDYEIIMDGANLTIKVNGHVENSATDVEILPGKICLQSEGAEMEYRNILLKPIESK